GKGLRGRLADTISDRVFKTLARDLEVAIRAPHPRRRDRRASDQATGSFAASTGFTTKPAFRPPCTAPPRGPPDSPGRPTAATEELSRINHLKSYVANRKHWRIGVWPDKPRGRRLGGSSTGPSCPVAWINWTDSAL